MNSFEKFLRISVFVSVLGSMLASPGFVSSAGVSAQPNKQEAAPTETLVAEPVLQEATPTPTDIPKEIPVEIPTDIPPAPVIEEPTAVPTDLPAEIPTDLPTPTPTDTPAEIATEPPTPTPTIDFTQTLQSYTPTITATPTETEIPFASSYAMFEELTLADGTSLEGINIIGPPTPPSGFEAERASVDVYGAFSSESLTTLNVPAYRWVFGCSAVSAAMIAAYYDNNGYPKMYTGPSNGGVMPMVDSSWPTWSDVSSSSYPSNPLIASKKGVDGRTTRGSIDDYWVQYGSYAADPYLTGTGWTQHSYGDAIGDYMRTSQSAYNNVDASTTFYNYTNGSSPLSCDYMSSAGLPDGTLGRKRFYEAKGYTVNECYNQRTDNAASGGFSFAQYKAQIQAGQPVLLNLNGHSIVGVGFDDASQTVYIHDTWDNSTHQMSWGGSYSGMAMQSVSIVNFPSTLMPAPVQLLPINYYSTNNSMPTFSWNSVPDAIMYSLQVSQDSSFSQISSLLIDSMVYETTLTPTTPLSKDGIWYWRVAGIDAEGKYGSWSTVRQLTFDTTPPESPILISPSDLSTPVGIPTFIWYASSGANGYQFEYDDSSDFSSPVFTSPDGTVEGEVLITTTNYRPASMPAGVQYYWRVRSHDSAGNWSTSWSAPFSLIVQVSLPVAPILASPATGYLTNSQPVLTWNSVPTGNTYQVQIANNTAFSGTIFEDRTKGAGILTHTVETTLTDGTWYWRVRAINSTTGIGPWSANRTFVVDFTLPAAPVLSAPANGAPNIRAIPTFSWTAVTGANAYQFQIDDTEDFSSPFFTTPGDSIPGTPLTVTTYKPADLSLLTTYQWRVRAKDIAGNWGNWSTSRNIRILPAIPAAPVLTSPTAKLLTNDTTPTFTWNAVTAAVTYHLQVDNLSTFASPEISIPDTSGALTYTSESALPLDNIYYWRVQAVNANGEQSAWSISRYFTLDTTPPLAPTLSLPANNAPNIRAIPTFSWVAVSGANAYQFQIDDNEDFSSPFITTPDGVTVPGTPLTVVSYKPAGLSLLTTYYWRVRARDTAGNWADWAASSARSIQILPVIPVAPVLSAPTAKLLINDTTPTFTWNAVTAGVTYHLQVDNLSTFASPEINIPDTSGALTYTSESALPLDNIYYWRVQAINANGEAGAWSISRYFTLDTTPPLAPTLSLPANNAPNIRAIPTFSWVAVSGANAYQFQIDDNEDFSSPYITTPDGDTVPGTPLTIVSYKPAGLDLLTTYYWRVRARDIAGNWADWAASSIRSIRILPVIPIAPVLTAPTAKLIINNTTPTFTWNAVTAAVTYHLQVDNLSTFASPEIDIPDTSGALTYTPSSPITPSALYYWRVQAINANGEKGTWSASRYFTLDTTPPLAPVLSSPANNALNIRAIPTFSWVAVSGANAYQFQIDDNEDFLSLFISTPDGSSVPGTPLTVVKYKPTTLNLLTPYYWRVRARDVAGNWGDWSGYRTITILPVIPVAPVLTSPSNGFLTNNTSPTLTWNAVAAGLTYHVQVDNLSTYASPEINYPDTSGALTYTHTSAITPVARYYWRVQAINANGEAGAWSASRYFTLDTTPPPAPVLSAPANNAANIRAIPTFSWVAVSGANAYQFQIDNNDDYSSPAFTTPDGSSVPGTPLAVVSYKPSSLDLLTTYYWHVRARDIAGNWGIWSVSRSITILPVIPTAPVLTSPANGILTNDATPTLTWNAVTAGVTYHVQIDNLATFASPEVNAADTGGALTFTPSTSITPDARYYWRVQAINANGEAGAWSAARYFTLDTSPPLAPVLSSPVDNASVLHIIPTFYWGASTGANAYQFQIDDNSNFSSPYHTTPGDLVPGTPLTVMYFKPTSLVVITPFYWHVRSRDAAGNWSAWSPTRTIVIQN